MNKLERASFLNGIIGKPWKGGARGPDAFDCWHCAQYVMQQIFQEQLPNIDVPEQPDWRWMIETFAKHNENKNWVEQLQPLNGLLVARDGSLVLMARLTRPVHIGVLFRTEKKVLHCHNVAGVCFDDLVTLRANGWTRLRYYTRATSYAN